MKRGKRGAGIRVDPARVREARIQAGLSMAELAGDDVSRTFIFLIERGRSRPSRTVLELIARRTRKPTSYFILPTPAGTQLSTDLVDDMIGIANRVRQFASVSRLTTVDREALKLIEVTLHQGADLVRAVQEDRVIGHKQQTPQMEPRKPGASLSRRNLTVE